MCPVATSPEMSPIIPDPMQDSLVSGNGGGNGGGEPPELSVYDIILCISQAHRTYCAYTDDRIRGLARCPIVVPAPENKDDNNVGHSSHKREKK